MAKEKQTCPTCQHELPIDAKPLAYFACPTGTAPQPDDFHNLYEDANLVINFLGALANAAPRAVHAMDDGARTDDFVMYLGWLGEELAQEALRRLERVKDAGQIWEERAGEKA